MQTHYTRSNGQKVEIATMPRPYCLSARDKLAREDRDGKRADEVEAMTARLATLDAEYAESIAESEGENPRIHLGANNPPEETKPEDAKPAPSGFDAIVVHISDLLAEAHNWADGAKVESEGQHDEVKRLIGDLRDAANAADDARKAEKRELDEKVKEIQDRYNVWIAPATNKKPGKVTVAIDALQATLKPWLDEQKRIRDEAAAKAQAEADAAAAIAAAALRATDVADLGGRDAAEALVDAAEAAARTAKQATKAATTGTGLTRFYVAKLTDQREAVLHYMKTQPGEFLSLVQRLADSDVRAGKRTIPGFDVVKDTRVNA